MSDLVSDGLLAELQRKIDDGTPRGIVWPMIADILVMAAPFAVTPEEVALANEALLAVIQNADDRALEQMELIECIEQLKAYLNREERP